MDHPNIEQQREWWNHWIAEYRETEIGEVSRRQADVAIGWIGEIQSDLGKDLDIIDVGCGSGWLCERLSGFGAVTGVDLAGEALARAMKRRPDLRYLAGDFMALDFEEATFDVAVSLEVLSHVEDQSDFLEKIAEILRPGGYLLLFNQNKWVLERNRGIMEQGEGQVRKWTTRDELQRLVQPWFEILVLTTLTPRGGLGVLRWINARKLNRVVAPFVGGQEALERLKERLGLGWTLALKARLK